MTPASFRDRGVADRPNTTEDTKSFDGNSHVRIAIPFKNAPFPFSARNTSPVGMFFTTPNSQSLIRDRPTARDTEKKGIPRYAFLVPSTGSNTKVYSPPKSTEPASSLHRFTGVFDFVNIRSATSSATLSM